MLTDILEDRRQAENLTDKEFARQLGVSRPLWIATRNGQRAIGLHLLRGVLRVFPDLDVEVLNFLRGDDEMLEK